MSLTLVPKQPTIDALAAVWSSLRTLIDDLDDADWTAMSPLPGWDVRANVAHIIGTEAMLLGIDTPPVDVDTKTVPHVLNDIGSFNEAWVIEMSTMAPAEVRDRFVNYTTQRLEALQTMAQDAWDVESWTPAGKDTYGRFMRIRAFDCWMHEQDIRDALGRHGHESGIAVELSLDEMAGALGYVVGKKAGAASGDRVTYQLTGDSGRDVHVEVGDRASVVESLSAPATLTLTMPVGTFTRLGGGRIRPDQARAAVAVQGDSELADRIIGNSAFTI